MKLFLSQKKKKSVIEFLLWVWEKGVKDFEVQLIWEIMSFFTNNEFGLEKNGFRPYLSLTELREEIASVK